MSVLQQSTIRLQVSTASNPPVYPIDFNTGLSPEAWRATTLAIALGVFDPDGDPVDLSEIDYIQLSVMDSASADQVLFTIQVDAEDIEELTVGAWRAGTGQNALFAITAAQMDVSLLALDSRAIWLRVVAVRDGAPIVLGAGPFTVFNPGSALPMPAPAITSLNEQTTEDGNVTVTPGSQLHTEVITVEGDARTASVILGINGVQDGAKLFLTLVLPDTPDITLNVRNVLIGNPVISTFTTGSVLKAYAQYYFKADDSAWVPELYVLPPT
jgi:hypothetical protein